MRALALIIGLPLLEIALFVTVGAWLGLWLTLAIVLGTAVLGIAILKRRGLVAPGLAQRAANPLSFAAESGLVMAAGLLLILPGFFTDTLGALLLIPALRRAVLRQIGQRTGLAEAVRRRSEFEGDGVVDAEFVDVTPRESSQTPSKWTEH